MSDAAKKGLNLHQAIMRQSGLVDRALGTLVKAVADHAEKDTEYRKQRAVVYETLRTKAAIGKAKGGYSEADLKAQVDFQTSEAMYEAHFAKGFMMASFKAIDARMAQLSALQTLAGGVKREMKFAQTAPEDHFNGPDES